MIPKYIILTWLIIMSGACAEMQSVLKSAGPVPLSEDEIVSGLKEALTTGAKNSAGILGAKDGYYGDATVRILFPEDAKMIIENISRIPGGEKLVQDVILSINRAAEDAASEAAPIFVNSVKQMTIRDAFNILHGSDSAATHYLRINTRNELFALYKPKIAASTGKKLIGPLSARDSWSALTGKWNSLANSVPGRLASLKPVTTDLDDYLTARALDGMFLKISIEELHIRKNVSARITPLLQKVFGSLDSKIK